MPSHTATDGPRLEGTLKVLPEPRADLLETVAAEYAALAAAHGPANVLVLKRHPAGLEDVRTALATVGPIDGTPASPRLESVPEHASKVLEEFDPTLERLEYEERIELLSLVVAGTKRDVPPYIDRAREHDSFARDVGQLLLEATRQRIRLEDCGPEIDDRLAFCYAINDRFHEALAERGLIERAAVIPRALELLAADADGLRTRVTASYEAVLALEFEECRRLDREYLATLTADADLVCLGERHASVERTRVEPGRLEDCADGLTVEVLERGRRRDAREADGKIDDRPPHAGITRYLATGQVAERDGAGPAGTAYRIHAETSREQLRAVAAEIQSLLERRDGWTHDDVGVVVPTVERIPAVRTGLRDAGVPTASVGTDTLAEDPAVNELYAVVAYHAGHERDRALERLEARLPDAAVEHLESTRDSSVRRSLERWMLRTDLKGRIAREEPWIDAAAQYESVRRVLEIARFVEETDLVGPDWRGLRRTLDRTLEYDAPYVHDVETRSPTGGVTVRAVADCKYDAWEAVFVLDCADHTYPGEHHLTQLFPTAWLREMPHYPAVTDPAPETVARTFATVETSETTDGVERSEYGDPFDVYHAQRARRALALATRAARTRLYCCTYEREAAGLRRTRDPSRYLSLLDAHPDLRVTDVDARRRTAAIGGRANALEAILEQPRGELERILREASTGGEADLGETEALFQELAVVRDACDDEDLAEAIRAQFAFAAGEVRRGE